MKMNTYSETTSQADKTIKHKSYQSKNTKLKITYTVENDFG